MIRRGLFLATLAAVSSSAFAQLSEQLIVSGLVRPVAMLQSPGDNDRIYIVEQRTGTASPTTGRIRIYKFSTNTLLATPFLSVGSLAAGSEQGLLGMAFHPNYASNGKFYVNVTVTGTGTTEIREYQRGATSADVASATPLRTILSVAQPFANHNAGTLQFGPDGFLYIGLGDGGSGGDPGDRALNPTNLLGKMLRVDVDAPDSYPLDNTKNFGVPSSNPFFGGTNPLPEIWATGLRNPWKYAFDKAENNGFGGLLTCDVGQNAWEEINYQRPAVGGLNYGWRVWEGNTFYTSSSFGPTTANSGVAPYTAPKFVYSHSLGFSISGGEVYRGVALGLDYWGDVFYGDYVSNWMRVLNTTWNGATQDFAAGTATQPSGVAVSSPVAFSLLNDGELYVAEYSTTNGSISRITRPTPSRGVSGVITFTGMTSSANPKWVNLELDTNGSAGPEFTLPIGMNAAQSYRIPCQNGVQKLSLKWGTFLRRTVSFEAATAMTTVNLALVNGNADLDGEIGPGDLQAVLDTFGLSSTDPGYNANADLDKDGEVGPGDLQIVLDNFGLEDEPI